MDSLPTFADASETARDAVESARDHGRTLIPWLPDPPRCPDCGALQYASETFDPRQACYVTSWHCRECDTHHRRDPEYGPDRVGGPTRGAPALRDLFGE